MKILFLMLSLFAVTDSCLAFSNPFSSKAKTTSKAKSEKSNPWFTLPWKKKAAVKSAPLDEKPAVSVISNKPASPRSVRSSISGSSANAAFRSKSYGVPAGRTGLPAGRRRI